MICGLKSREKGMLTEMQKAGIKYFYRSKAIYDKKPETGICKAHKNALKRSILLNVSDHAIIMEDDIEFTHADSYKYFLDSFRHLPKSWDIFYGGYSSIEQASPEQENVFRVNYVGATHLYAINAKFFQKFMTANENIHLDIWLSDPLHSNAECYAASPMAAIQKNGLSQNTNKEENYEGHFKRFKLFSGFTN
jgi:hypothetical protein